jgi:hypothetical protein
MATLEVVSCVDEPYHLREDGWWVSGQFQQLAVEFQASE